MDLLQKIATGMFKTNMPSEAEKVKPKKVLVTFSINIATPVKPELNRFNGLIKI